jgi:hypothetical protein
MTETVYTKKSGSVREFLARQKSQPITPLADNKAVALDEFSADSHIQLEEIISGALSKFGVVWIGLKAAIRPIKDSHRNGFWYEEYMAMVCHVLFSNIPIEERINWLSVFLNRSKNNVKSLLALHYHLNYADVNYSEVNYCDFYADINRQVSVYFKKYYKYQPDFKYQ